MCPTGSIPYRAESVKDRRAAAEDLGNIIWTRAETLECNVTLSDELEELG